MRKTIQKIIEKGTKEDMEMLADEFCKMLNEIETTNIEMHDDISSKLYEAVNGMKITEDLADKWVNSMKPRAKWSKEQTDGVLSGLGIDIPSVDFYVLMNMLYTDNRNLLGEATTEEELNNYIMAVKDWYFDEDVPNGSEKLYKYYKYIVK